jgi:rRNA methylases
VDIVSSTRNPEARLIRALSSDKKEREKTSLYVVEGYNILKDLDSFEGKLYIREDKAEKFIPLAERLKAEYKILAEFVFDYAADAVNSGGVLAVMPIKKPEALSGDVIVLDGVSDAGNVGTIVRTAAAMGIKDVISIDSADFYNPKAVRAAMGGLFKINPISYNSREEALSALSGYTVASLDMKGEDVYYYEPPGRLALAVGSEVGGVSEEFLKASSKILSVPMPGGMESLNAAVSLSIALSVITHRKDSYVRSQQMG